MSEHARYARLAKMSEIINSNLQLDHVLEAVTTIISEEVVQCDSVGIYLPEEGGCYRGYIGKPNFLSGVTLDQMVIDPSVDKLAQEMIETRRSIYIPDTAADSRPDPRPIQLFQINSLFSLPIAFEQELYGLVYLFNYGAPLNLTKEQMQAVEAYVNMAAVAIRNGKQFAHIEKLLSEKQLQLDLSRELALCVTEKQILDTCFRYVGQVLDNHNIGVHLCDFQGKKFRPAKLSSDSEWKESDWKDTHKEIKLNYEEDLLFQEVIQTGKAVLIPDVSVDPRPNHKACRQFGIQGLFMMPLVAAREVLGTIAVVSLGRTRTYTEAEMSLAQSIVDVTASALSNVIQMEQLEAIIKERTEEALSKNRLIELILHSAGEGIYGLNMDGRITFCNPATASMLGYETEELLGARHEQILCPVDALDMEWGEAGRSFLDEPHQNGTEWLFRRKNGECFTVEIVRSPIMEDDKVVGSVILFKDITERKQAEDIIRRAEKLAVVGELAAGVAHEIRNPLTSLKGFVQLLMTNPTVKRSYLEIMLSELERMNSIVSEFLFLAKPQEVQVEECDLVFILEKVVSLLQSEAHLKNVQLWLNFQVVPLFIQCSENQLKQAFINVLKNAIEAMPGGGVILIDASQPEPDRILVKIVDQGTGIAKERMTKLGEPFFTTKEKGFGLGLMVTNQIIRQHRGQLVFESDGESGTTVLIWLPVE